jgi:hypothetical protein
MKTDSLVRFAPGFNASEFLADQEVHHTGRFKLSS